MTTEKQKTEEKWVLVVEDDVFIDKAYATKFTHENIPIKIATDGEEALTILAQTENHPPAVVLLDLMLPKKNGFEVLGEIKKNPKLKNIPVMVMTNLGQEADAKRGIDMGATEYLVKADTKINDILEKVKKYLGTPTAP